MVAGTLVVREREVDAPMWGESTSRTLTAARTAAPTNSRAILVRVPPHLRVTLPAPALAKLSPSDLEVLEGFFSRRLDMDLDHAQRSRQPHCLGPVRKVRTHHPSGDQRGNLP